jgi:hypothetical protein
MMTMDQKWGGRPGRSHDYGHIPWNEASKVNDGILLYDVE